MASTGLLLLSNPSKIAGLLPLALKHVNKTLYIHWNPNPSNLRKIIDIEPAQWPLNTQTVGRIYFQVSVYC